ncbi:MAG: hypothetical protein WCA46_24710 [Actinocatenispora sp.]
MQTIGPYALRDLLGEGPAGRVWRALDQQGSQVAMAVLEGHAASDPQRRWQFTTTVEQLRQNPGAVHPLAADLVGPQPWAAFPDDGGIAAAGVFAAMGAPAAQVPGAPPSQFAPPQATQIPADAQVDQPTQMISRPVSSPPVSGQPMSAQPMSGQPMSAQPMSGQPAQQSFVNQPDPNAPDPFAPVDPFGSNDSGPAPDPVNPFPSPGPENPTPFSQNEPPRYTPYQVDSIDPPPRPRFTDPEPRPRGSRKGLLIGLVVLVVVLLGGGVSGAIYLTQHSGKPDAHKSASPAPSTKGSSKPTGSPVPQTQQSAPSTPKEPGKEPPKDGSWPAKFATFSGKDKSRSLGDLAGLGFALTVPDGWTCTKKDQSTSYVNYHCGTADAKVGGDLVVRNCAEPCDPAKKIKMRSDEEAWGLQWVRDGGNCSYAESSKVKVAGKSVYGLVMVRYWHSKPGGPMDRQVVFRMTAPKSGAADLQKVASAVRDATQ